MTFLQALSYFFREAALNLARSWKISFVAVSTIAVSLFLGGVFLLVLDNLSRLLAEWREEARVVVYLRVEEPPEALLDRLEEVEWVRAVVPVSAGEARSRFRVSFPSVAELLEGWEGEPLPASIEVVFDPLAVEREEFATWLRVLADDPAVAMVDDDRDWLRQLEAMLRFLAGLGLVLGGVLLVAAVFTIASVIRLTAHLYRDEIAVMRLVGATEFYIRGPFYVEGLLQGLAGGALALGGLFLGHRALLPGALPELVSGALASRFLPPGQQLALVLLGGLSGLIGAVVSLRREQI